MGLKKNKNNLTGLEAVGHRADNINCCYYITLVWLSFSAAAAMSRDTTVSLSTESMLLMAWRQQTVCGGYHTIPYACRKYAGCWLRHTCERNEENRCQEQL